MPEAAQAYECLANLEGTSTLAQQALVGIKALNREELRNLSVYFDRVSPHPSIMIRGVTEEVRGECCSLRMSEAD